MKKLFIIDGNSLINRAFYALPPLTNTNGVYVNAVFGFINIITKLIATNNPDYMVVAFDHARKTFRNQIFEEYKGTRKPAPHELVSQFDILKKVLKCMNIKMIEQEGIEADDIIGTVCSKSGVTNIIITGDRDCLQLINKDTQVWLTQKGISEIKEVNSQNIKELYNLNPSQIIDYKALAGDSSDNIPGVAGIGEKSAMSLLDKYKNIDNIYNNIEEIIGKQKEKLMTGKDMCYISYKLATIKKNCDILFDINECIVSFPYSQEVKDIFKEYEFATLLKRDDIFKIDEQNKFSQTEYIFVENFEVLKKLLSNFSENYFCFDFSNDFKFSLNNKNYILQKEMLLFEDKINFESNIKEIILPILLNENILKILYDAKATMHLLKIEKISNFFDLSLAGYILSGGQKQTIKQDPVSYLNLYKTNLEKLKQNNQEKLYFDIELPLINVLYEMENLGFKIDRNELLILSNQLFEELKHLEDQFNSYCNGKQVNIKSPKQLAEFLFQDLKLSDKGNKKHSTNVDMLILIKDQHPVVDIILRHRKVAKMYSTYVEPFLKMIGEDGLIHTIFNQMQTSTGRLSSSEPNLQNIPIRSEEGKNIRKIFVSRFKDGSLVSADYNQIELRLLANFSKDEKLLKDYSSNTDIHKQTASQIFGIDINNVTPLHRRMAKAVNFGIIYGISGFGLSKNIDVPVYEAKNYIDVYFQKYPGVKQYLDNLIIVAKQKGYSLTLFNRRRNIPELSSSNGLQVKLGERLAMNSPLQGSASDIIKVAMVKVFNKLKLNNLKSKLILQIHDELIIDCFPGEEKQVQQILIDEMQNVYNADVPLLVEIGIGKTWYDC